MGGAARGSGIAEMRDEMGFSTPANFDENGTSMDWGRIPDLVKLERRRNHSSRNESRSTPYNFRPFAPDDTVLRYNTRTSKLDILHYHNKSRRTIGSIWEHTNKHQAAPKQHSLKQPLRNWALHTIRARWRREVRREIGMSESRISNSDRKIGTLLVLVLVRLTP